MTIESDARAEAVSRYASRLIEDYDGDRYDEDEYGYDETARRAFAAGAKWAASRPVTDEMVERASHAIYNTPDPFNSGRDNDLTWTEAEHYARAALEAALGGNDE